MNMREQFESRFPTPAGVEWDEANQCYKCKVPSPYLALWMGWSAAHEAYTAVDMGTAAADGYQDGKSSIVVTLPRGDSLARRMYGPQARGENPLISRKDAVEAIEAAGGSVAP